VALTVVAVAPGWHRLDCVSIIEDDTVLWDISQHSADAVLVHRES
jgi:hypothetical protein